MTRKSQARDLKPKKERKGLTKIGRPMSPRAQLIRSRGPRILYLSPTHAMAYMNAAASIYGGVERHCDMATLMFIFSLKMMGRKKDSDEAMVVQELPEFLKLENTVFHLSSHGKKTYKRQRANPQIFRSRADEAQAFQFHGSPSASLRSRLILRMMKAISSRERKRQYFLSIARSGKSTIKIHPAIPTKQVYRERSNLLLARALPNQISV